MSLERLVEELYFQGDANSAQRSAFEQLLRARHVEEIGSFLGALVEYKKNPTAGKAQQMYERYLEEPGYSADGAAPWDNTNNNTETLNVSSRVLEDFRQSQKRNPAAADLFDPVYNEMVRLLAGNGILSELQVVLREANRAQQAFYAKILVGALAFAALSIIVYSVSH